MSYIEIKNIWKYFQNNVILKKINLKIEKGTFICIFGPNGCGKTTLLNIIAGILIPDAGYVSIDGKKSNDNIIGYIFQDYRESLLPWKTNLENIAFPLELRGISKKERNTKVRDIVKNLNLRIPLDSYPYQSSGGEQQLVALLREIIAEPKVILMDEPFSSLHCKSRDYLKIEIQKIYKKLGLTIIFVSHEITETMQLADRIIVMKKYPGEIINILNINFPRPRTEELVFSSGFSDIREILRSQI
ncbi:MAG TPA: ABC transporter ATP-binding protein [Candidatus Moranbacteria bacterium]|nr:ABC transporter ATP-binding protein [Candidatus Moranbacteria bacterium]